MQPQFPQLTFEQAKSISNSLSYIYSSFSKFLIPLSMIGALDEAIESFEIPENKERMLAAIASCAALEPMQRMLMLMPIVQEIQGVTMAKYGFQGPGAVMNATMQINMYAMQDPDMQNKVKMLMAKASGN